MKNFIFVCTVLLSFVLSACKNEPDNWVTISVVEDIDTTFHCIYLIGGEIKTWISTKTNKELIFNLQLLPESEDYIDIVQVYSTNPDVICINSIDLNNRKISTKTLNTGEAKIFVITRYFSSCCTANIVVD